MNEETKMVCVRVDCHCVYPPNWLYYPKDLIGIHRISSADSRVKIGSLWAEGGEYCHGGWYSQGCEDENCSPAGEVVEIILECADCPHKEGYIHKDK